MKISATVDPDLLRAVDRYVQEHDDSNRSKVLDEALLLWYEQQQANAMEEQFASPKTTEERAEREVWRRIRTAVAAPILHRTRA